MIQQLRSQRRRLPDKRPQEDERSPHTLLIRGNCDPSDPILLACCLCFATPASCPLAICVPQEMMQQPCQVHPQWLGGRPIRLPLIPLQSDLTQNCWLPDRDSALEIRCPWPIPTSASLQPHCKPYCYRTHAAPREYSVGLKQGQ